MSFSSTPLGQGRRLDHSTFLNKPPSNGNRPPSPKRLIPTSYSYGAPTAASRSPPKPTSPSRDGTNLFTEENDQNEPALARFARLKQQEQLALASRPGGPKIITSPPKPERWSVKDTSVNIATAFTQAATDMQPVHNPNSAWASGSSRPNPGVPRSTSVEYEREAQATIARRLPAPVSRHAPPRSTTGRRPLTKTSSARHVSDSEGEVERPVANGRGKSPFEDVYDSAKRVLAPVSFYLQQKLQVPGEISLEESSTATANGKEASYDYTAEEQEFQASQTRNAKNQSHKRGRISVDNKAYKPPVSDHESSEDDSEGDEKTKKRRKKKKKDSAGLFNQLPVITHDKKRKKKSRGSKQNLEEEDDESDSEENTDRQSVQQRTSIPRNSVPLPPSRYSVPRGSVPPEYTGYHEPETSMDVEQGLNSIPEVNEDSIYQDTPDTSYEQQHEQKPRRRSVSRPPPPSSHIGGPIGSVVYFITRVFKFIVYSFVQCLVTTLYTMGRVFGTIASTVWVRPVEWASGASPGARLLFTLAKYAAIAVIILGTYHILQEPLMQYIPRLMPQSGYHPPSVPASNIAELAMRLQRIENALASMSGESEKARTRGDTEAKSRMELASRLGTLEGRIAVENKRSSEAETQFRNLAKDGLKAVRQEIEVLQAQVQTQHQHQQHQGKKEEGGSDEEARARLKALEERVGTVGGDVKDALELGKKVPTGGGVSTGTTWWQKPASGSPSKSGLTIKSSDGQDVTALIEELVSTAVSKHGKDGIGRPDFALHSSGASIIPSLTSPTLEIGPTSLHSQLIGLVTGSGYAIGRPPITALHHELHNGHCWPFSKTQGQLGVKLAAPVFISHVSIDHVSLEEAFDMRTSAPREMELWGMVEGKDNIAKVKEWIAEKTKKREAAIENGEEVEAEEEYPKAVLKSPHYIRVASFSYDVNAPNHIQTFPASQEIQDLGVDFGIVVLRIRSNWGKEEFTCLYRIRVHGQRMGAPALPHPEEPS
ncbi:hypothetical protein BDZ94DRAFT_1184307 [Collybia nuda]|uniref:SUN domain-containing protein n=1 Tax=Collybia nuda TaxID=64659 RepID=A0A9P5YDM2_9AGAR|nr:hypothetical protein BDZ94DRAFT_1184307 [Collybia nuda]